jgi:hypothetical protein
VPIGAPIAHHASSSIAIDDECRRYWQRPFIQRPVAGQDIQIESLEGVLELFGKTRPKAHPTS